MPKTRFARLARKGFTIIELLIVVIVVGVLASAGIAKYQEFAERSRRGTCTSNQVQIDNALNAYFLQTRGISPALPGCLLFRPMDGSTQVQQDAYGWPVGSMNRIIAMTMGDTKGFLCPGTLAVYYAGDRSRITVPTSFWGKNGLGSYVHSHQGRDTATPSFVFPFNGMDPIAMPRGHSFVYCDDYGRVGATGPDGSVHTRHSPRW